MLRKKNIVLNDKKADGNETVKAGDVIKLYMRDETIDGFRTSEVSRLGTNNTKTKLDIIYEDDDYIFCNKPVNLLSQKAKKDDVSINEMIISYLLENGSITEESLKLFRPSICNRLDRNTSGIILAAKTPKGARFLSKIIKDRSLRKYYLAVVPRKPAKLGHFTAYLSKDESSNKVTIYNKKTDGAALIETDVSLIEYNPKTETSLLSIELITGKSHQIRAHLASLRMPIIGDIKYGSELINEMYKKNYGVKSQLLSAYKVEFPESADNILSGKVFYAKPPHSFDSFIIRKDIISGNMENQRS